MRVLFNNLLNYKSKYINLHITQILKRRRHILESKGYTQGVKINWEHYEKVLRHKFLEQEYDTEV